MSNALTTRGTTALATAGAVDPFAAAADDMGASGAVYMKFNGNTGEYSFGAEAEELPEGTRLAVNMRNFRRGYICWKDEEVVDEIMVKVIDGNPPAEHQLPDHGPYSDDPDDNEGWSEQAAVDFRSVEDGREFVFKTSSKSGRRALGQLLKDYARQYKVHEGELPIIELATQSWMPKEKKHGKKYSPVFKIVDWANEEALAAQVEGEDPADYAADAAETVETTAAPAPERRAPPANRRTRAF